MILGGIMMHTTTTDIAPRRCAGATLLSLAVVAVGGCATPEPPEAPGAPEAPTTAVGPPEEFGVIRTCNAAYPQAAGGIQGHVEMTFQVGIEGKPFNIAVAESEPPALFDSVAIDALACWRFQPELDTSRVRRVIIEFVP